MKTDISNGTYEFLWFFFAELVFILYNMMIYHTRICTRQYLWEYSIYTITLYNIMVYSHVISCMSVALFSDMRVHCHYNTMLLKLLLNNYY